MAYSVTGSDLLGGTLHQLAHSVSLSFVVLLMLTTTSATADESPETRIVVLPQTVLLHGPETSQRLLVERLSDGRFVGVPDKTTGVSWSSTNPNVVRVEAGEARPVNDGTAAITATVNGYTTSAKVEVRGMDQPQQWEFRRHVLPILSKAGCNSGACHGALAGKGGFKLSLRGYNPVADHFNITRQARGRRIELADPGRSLLLAKPSASIPHKGGLRIDTRSAEYHLLANWISAGAPPPTDFDPQLEDIEVLPKQTSLRMGSEQPLIVRARYADGRIDDVTRWAKFSSTNDVVAKVDDQGKVTVVGHGEGAVVVWFSSQIVLSRVTVPYENEVDPSIYAEASRRNFIDEIVLEKLASLNLVPSPSSSDSEFLRRAYLDTIGTLPTAAEVESFLEDGWLDKRDRLIEQLLSRTEFVDYWTYVWSDLLLVNGRRLRPKAVKSYYTWIRHHVRNGTPWDEMVRQVITATGETEANGATNFYSLHQSPEEMTENVCQAFMSLSIGCAKCHNHPLEKWTNDQYYALASHFSRVRGKGWGGDARSGDGLRTVILTNHGELIQPISGKPQPPTPLDGQALSLDAPGDRRQHLARWMTSPENPYFSRAIANRIWANFFGIGLVQPVDDLRTSNPASNEELLSALADFLVQRDFDVKSLMRVILQSETYQRSSASLPENKDDDRFFSRYYPRRLSAEVLLDAIAQVTEVPTEFTQIGYDGSDVEKTDEYPPGTRAIQLSDSAVVSNFLKTFGRNERDITCECERSNTPSMVQVLHINNGVTINDRLAAKTSCVARAVGSQAAAEAVVDEAYLRTLSRWPTNEEKHELTAILDEATEQDETRELLEDLYWSIMSSREFLFNH